MSERIDLINELTWRGLLKDCTDEDGLREHLSDPDNSPRKIYAGFDPTADSLTIGNLVPIMLLAHVKRAGHSPIVVMGGGTGLIGDPSGKSAERQLNTVETIAGYIEKQRPIYSTVLDQIDGPDHEILNNHDWLKDISYIEALRDIGKHFSVNMMMQKESVKERLNNREQGISYTEFSYMILQAYDFAYLYEDEGVTVQIGGSDQYGNIIAGKDLIRRKRAAVVTESTEFILEAGNSFGTVDISGLNMDLSRKIKDGKGNISEDFNLFKLAKTNIEQLESLQEWLNEQTEALNFTEDVRAFLRDYIGKYIVDLAWVQQGEAFGLTAPLVQKADGGKFGKTEKGAIWLTAARTSPYAYYQFWLNATDEDARGWIKVFTFLDQPTIESLIGRHDENPGKRELQRTLAQEATRILHGQDAMENAEAAGKALFSGDIGSLDEATMLEVFASVPTTEHSKGDLAGGLDMVEMLKSTNLASSNREARDFLNEGSVSINGEKITMDTVVDESSLLHGSIIAIRRGKKKWHMTRWK
ncbi:MAG: tyrosine--tRNA ligase [Phycisphaerales bacterium]|nr:tyrosine--tRNA ligase [Phycisphaerales bacterium]